MRAGASPLAVAASTCTAVASSASPMRPTCASTPARSPAADCTSPGRPASRASVSARSRSRSASSVRPRWRSTTPRFWCRARRSSAEASPGMVRSSSSSVTSAPARSPTPCWAAPRLASAPGRLPFGSSCRSAATAARRSSSTTGPPPNWATIGVTIEVARASGAAANGAYAVAARNGEVSSRRAHRRVSRLASRSCAASMNAGSISSVRSCSASPAASSCQGSSSRARGAYGSAWNSAAMRRCTAGASAR